MKKTFDIIKEIEKELNEEILDILSSMISSGRIAAI